MEIKTVIAETGGERIDSFLAEELPYSRSKIKKLIDDGKITVANKQVKAKYEVKVGDIINMEESEPEKLDLEPVNEPIDIVYQDDDVAVINKPQGLTVHAGNGVKGYTLVNLLLYHLNSLSGINGVIRPGIVHRIDKDTSGLLVVAKNDNAHISLASQIAEKTCKRTYVALLEGVVKQDEGVIETYIGRSDSNRTMMAVKNSGRVAITNFKVLKRFENHTYCEFKLQTGRTHQIRVHSKYIGHPIVGDPVYGYKNQKFKLNGQLLHAISLEFTHPKTNERMKFNAPIPDYFSEVLSKLKK